MAGDMVYFGWMYWSFTLTRILIIMAIKVYIIFFNRYLTESELNANQQNYMQIKPQSFTVILTTVITVNKPHPVY